jgi:hypothetical protein
MTRNQLVLAFILISILQWVLMGCAAPRVIVQVSVDRDDVEYVAQLEM